MSRFFVCLCFFIFIAVAVGCTTTQGNDPPIAIQRNFDLHQSTDMNWNILITGGGSVSVSRSNAIVDLKEIKLTANSDYSGVRVIRYRVCLFKKHNSAGFDFSSCSKYSKQKISVAPGESHTISASAIKIPVADNALLSELWLGFETTNATGATTYAHSDRDIFVAR